MDKDDTLSEEEARPFIRNFAQLVIGMEPKVAYDEKVVNSIYREMGGGEEMNPINKVSMYNFLFKYRNEGSCEKATMEGEVYQEEASQKLAVHGGKHGLKDHVVNWNPRP